MLNQSLNALRQLADFFFSQAIGTVVRCTQFTINAGPDKEKGPSSV